MTDKYHLTRQGKINLLKDLMTGKKSLSEVQPPVFSMIVRDGEKDEIYTYQTVEGSHSFDPPLTRAEFDQRIKRPDTSMVVDLHDYSKLL